MAEIQLDLLQVHPVFVQGRQGQVADLKDAAHEDEFYLFATLIKVMKESAPKGALENKGDICLLLLCPGNRPVGCRSWGDWVGRNDLWV